MNGIIKSIHSHASIVYTLLVHTVRDTHPVTEAPDELEPVEVGEFLFSLLAESGLAAGRPAPPAGDT